MTILYVVYITRMHTYTCTDVNILALRGLPHSQIYVRLRIEYIVVQTFLPSVCLGVIYPMPCVNSKLLRFVMVDELFNEPCDTI